jgi:hypothetical protein
MQEISRLLRVSFSSYRQYSYWVPSLNVNDFSRFSHFYYGQQAISATHKRYEARQFVVTKRLPSIAVLHANFSSHPFWELFKVFTLLKMKQVYMPNFDLHMNWTTKPDEIS